MTEIGVHEAKTHFSKILKRIEAGESFSITNRGKVVAVITRPEDAWQVKAQQAFGRLMELREKHPIGTVKEVVDWKNKGRR